MSTWSRKVLLSFIVAILTMSVAPAAGLAAHSGKAHAAKDRRALPIVIGHRGASAYRPEHTLALLPAGDRDGRRLHRARPRLDQGPRSSSPATRTTSRGTTDVADHPEFADRRTTRTIDGVSHHGLVHRGLHARRAQDAARDRAPARTSGRPTRRSTGSSRSRRFQEVIDLAKREGVGIYPETKHPTYFDSIGLSLEEPLRRRRCAQRARPPRREGVHPVLRGRQPAASSTAKTQAAARAAHRRDRRARPTSSPSGDPRTYADLVTPAGLRRDRHATPTGSAPTRAASSRATRPARLHAADDARARRPPRRACCVHPFTFRPENNFLRRGLPRRATRRSPRVPAARAATSRPSWRCSTGSASTALFADNADTAVAVREKTFRHEEGDD